MMGESVHRGRESIPVGAAGCDDGTGRGVAD
jgi:hypothetical protein